MQADLERSELVRCVACHAIYEQVIAPGGREDGGACPLCGDCGWLAAWVPFEEPAAPVPA